MRKDSTPTDNEMLNHANYLELLQSVENGGRGVSCVRSIVHYLRLSDWESALAVRKNEGDKIRSYPILDRELTIILGCRLHGIRQCAHDLCKP